MYFDLLMPSPSVLRTREDKSVRFRSVVKKWDDGSPTTTNQVDQIASGRISDTSPPDNSVHIIRVAVDDPNDLVGDI